MVSVVEKWATSSGYFGPQLEIVERSKKVSLEQVFRESTQAVREQSRADFDLYIMAARNAERRFNKALYGGNFFVSLLKRALSPFGNKPFIAAHNEFIEALASRAAEHYRNNFEGLVDIRKRPYFNDKIFLDAVIRAAEKNISSRNDSQGFFYTIQLDDEIKGYIIGTTPYATPIMLQDDRFKKILGSCFELWIEQSKEERFRILPWIKSFLFGKGKQSNMASSLISIAQKLGISTKKIVSSKDERSSQSETLSSPRSSPSSPPSSPSPPPSPRRKSSNPIKIHTDYAAMELIEAWQQGDEDYVKTLVEGDLHPLIRKATLATRLQELFGNNSDLLNKIRQSTRTFCLALDASYIVAGKGLLDALERNSFTIRKNYWIE